MPSACKEENAKSYLQKSQTRKRCCSDTVTPFWHVCRSPKTQPKEESRAFTANIGPEGTFPAGAADGSESDYLVTTT